MTTTPRRLPKGLKKKLEGSLGSLTPRQAARLFLLYYHEGDRKRIDASIYPPIRELKAALEDRIKKGKADDDRQKQFHLYNGFMFFVMLAIDANKAADEDFFRMSLSAVMNHSMLASLMKADYASELVKSVMTTIQYNAYPVRPEDYDRLIEWTKTDALIDLKDYADNFTVEWDAKKHTEETYQALCDVEYNKLVDLVKAGELEGGQAVRLNSGVLANEVLIVDGCVPAWAALRAIWPAWLADHDHFVKNEATFDDESIQRDDTAIAGLRQVYNAEGNVEGEALVTLAAEFFADCKAKPWGKGLVASGDVDLKRLGRFLIEVETDLTELTAPDLGRVNLAAFAEAEANIDVTPSWAATQRGLNKLAGGEGDWSDAIRDAYYPILEPGYTRHKWSRAMRNLSRLRVDRPSFSYKRIAGDDDEDTLGLGDIYGVEFLTPLEEEVKRFADLTQSVATLKRFCEIISDEYFGGLPLLIPSIAAKVDYLDQTIDDAEDMVTGWHAYVKQVAPKVDTSSLQMIRLPADEEVARRKVEGTIEYSMYMLKLSDREEVDLGPDEAPLTMPKARKNSHRKDRPQNAGGVVETYEVYEADDEGSDEA